MPYLSPHIRQTRFAVTKKSGRIPTPSLPSRELTYDVRAILEDCGQTDATELTVKLLNSWVVQKWLRVSNPFSRNKEGTIKDDIDSIYSSLHYSSNFGLAEATKLSLTNGVNINAPGKWVGSCLVVAAQNGYSNLVRLLLEHGAAVGAVMSETGSTALHRAASKGHEASVRLLIQAGAEVAALDRRGEIALPLAAFGGEEKVSKLLLDPGARVGDASLDGHTALHEACLCDYVSVVRLLLEWDAAQACCS